MKKDKLLLKVTYLFLTITWYVAWAILAMYTATSVIVPLATGGTYVNAIPVHFSVPAEPNNVNVVIETGTDSKAIDIPAADGILAFSSTDYKMYLFGVLGILIDSAAVLFIVFQLRKIVAKVREGKPFMSENLLRIRKINVMILCYAAAKSIYAFVASVKVQTELYAQLYLPHIQIKPEFEMFNSNLILLFLIILVIEHSFRMGLKLQEDKDLTI